MGTRKLAFVIEETADGDAVVLFPTAPAPTVGQVHLVACDGVERLDVAVSAVMDRYWQLGAGTGDVLARYRRPAP